MSVIHLQICSNELTQYLLNLPSTILIFIFLSLKLNTSYPLLSSLAQKYIPNKCRFEYQITNTSVQDYSIIQASVILLIFGIKHDKS